MRFFLSFAVLSVLALSLISAPASVSGATCNPGQYWYTANGNYCSSCDSGYRCPGDAIMYRCDPGTFSSTSSAISCTLCPANTYMPTAGARSCTPCQQGASSPPGSVICGEPTYVPGKYSLNLVYHDCEPGFQCDRHGRAPCAVGTFQDKPAQDHCTKCPSGTYSPSTGAQGCIHCAPGMWTQSAGQSVCTLESSIRPDNPDKPEHKTTTPGEHKPTTHTPRHSHGTIDYAGNVDSIEQVATKATGSPSPLKKMHDAINVHVEVDVQ